MYNKFFRVNKLYFNGLLLVMVITVCLTFLLNGSYFYKKKPINSSSNKVLFSVVNEERREIARLLYSLRYNSVLIRARKLKSLCYSQETGQCQWLKHLIGHIEVSIY